MCSQNAPLISKVSSMPYKQMTPCVFDSNSLTCLKANSFSSFSLIHMPKLAMYLTIGATKQAYVYTVIAKGSMVGERSCQSSWSKRKLVGQLGISNSPILRLSISPLQLQFLHCRSALQKRIPLPNLPTTECKPSIRRTPVVWHASQWLPVHEVVETRESECSLYRSHLALRHNVP